MGAITTAGRPAANARLSLPTVRGRKVFPARDGEQSFNVRNRF
jgi:hypothetical protein